MTQSVWVLCLICDGLSQRHKGSWQWVALEFRGWKGKTWQQRRNKGTAVTCINFLHLLYTLYQSIHNIYGSNPHVPWNSTKWFINTVCSVPGHFTFADIHLMILKFSSILHISKPASHVKIGLDHISFPYT